MSSDYIDTYAQTDLFDEALRCFSGDATKVAFPLGGIGTGNVSIGARGQLRDWELFNRPQKGTELPYSFFALWCDSPDSDPIFRVLESQLQPPHTRSHGYSPPSTAGLPRFDDTEFHGEYPVAEVTFLEETIPVEISLTAYTPFIPLNPDDSGLPVAVFEYTVTNTTDEPLAVSIAGSLTNPSGYRPELEPGYHRNKVRHTSKLSGLQFTSEKYPADALGYGDAALTTTATAGVTHTATWERADWWDAYRAFGEDFRADGRLTANNYDESSAEGESDIGSLAVSTHLAPGESETITFMLTWYFPNRPYRWDQSLPEETANGELARCEDSNCCSDEDTVDVSTDATVALVQNHYATRFDSAWDVATYVADGLDRLRGRTFDFHDAFFGSTLPGHVLEAVSSQMTVLRSHTCLWLEDGTFLGYEGCAPDSGCCHGTCTHVWNYAWTLAALFPSLERQMRHIDFENSTDADGWMLYRTPLPLETESDHSNSDDLPAADGQLGTVMRLYREWRYSGDDAFLERLWPSAKRALEFAFTYKEWDPDREGVLTGEQHNTYDIEFYGQNALSQSWYLGALRAGAELAHAVGDEETAELYEAVLKKGRERTDERLWNGEYYVQDAEDIDTHRYQYGHGCLSDQLLGQWYAELLDLEPLLPREQVRTTLESIYRYNFRTDLSEHTNYQRTYALNDEAGLLLCSWPHGDEPDYPFVYSNEVWTGVEYQVASHLITEGYVQKGLKLVRAIRQRHDGYKRNPWNEFECGNHYARAMASWSVYIALCGLSVDLTGHRDIDTEHGFAIDPAIEREPFNCFWITGDEWGVYDRDNGDETIEVLYKRDRE